MSGTVPSGSYRRSCVASAFVLVAVTVFTAWYGWPLLRMGWDMYDDGLILRRAAEIEAGGSFAAWKAYLYGERDWGRFRPAYWWYVHQQVRWFGTHPALYRAAHLLLFALAAALVAGLGLWLCDSRQVALVAGLLFAVFGPFPQLGQDALFSWGRMATGEPPSVVFTVLLVGLCWWQPPAGWRWPTARAGIIALCAMFLALLKETNVAIPLACVLVPWLRDARRGRGIPTQWWDGVLCAALPACVALGSGVLLLGTVGRSGYAATWVAEGQGGALGAYQRYFTMLLESYGPLVPVAIVLLAVRTAKRQDPGVRPLWPLVVVGLAGMAPLGLWGQVYSRYLTLSVALWAIVLAEALVWLMNAAVAAFRSGELYQPARAITGVVGLWLLIVWLLVTASVAWRGRQQFVAARIDTHATTYALLLEALVKRRPATVLFDVRGDHEIIGNTHDLLQYAYGIRIRAQRIAPGEPVDLEPGAVIVQNPNISPRYGSLAHLPQLERQLWRIAVRIERSASFPAVATWLDGWNAILTGTVRRAWQERPEMYNGFYVFERVQ